jgi:hypothetical protein
MGREGRAAPVLYFRRCHRGLLVMAGLGIVVGALYRHPLRSAERKRL